LAALLMGIAVAVDAANGTLCLTFDDIYYSSWLQNLPLFQKYNARATFFISRRITEDVLEQMKKLQDAGHSIGLHSENHTRAVDYMQKFGSVNYILNEIMPQLEICKKNNIRIRAFAYPCSQRDKRTDQELFKTFDFLRTNSSEVKKWETPLAKADGCFVKNVQAKQLFYGYPASGNFKVNEVKEAMKRAARENSVLVLYAHDITQQMQPKNHITIDQLTILLEHARKLGMAIRGMNEL